VIAASAVVVSSATVVTSVDVHIDVTVHIYVGVLVDICVAVDIGVVVPVYVRVIVRVAVSARVVARTTVPARVIDTRACSGANFGLATARTLAPTSPGLRHSRENCSAQKEREGGCQEVSNVSFHVIWLLVACGGFLVLCENDLVGVSRRNEDEGVIVIGRRQVPGENRRVLRAGFVGGGAQNQLSWERVIA
jgi:hypothetical protein